MTGIRGANRDPFDESTMPDTSITTRLPALPAIGIHTSRLVDAAMLEVLPHLATQDLNAIVSTMIARGDDASMIALVSQFQSYPTPLKQAIAFNCPHLFPAIRAACNAGTLSTRLSALSLIHESQDARIAYLAADALTLNCPRTRSRAAQVLRSLAELHCPPIKAGGGLATLSSRNEIHPNEPTETSPQQKPPQTVNAALANTQGHIGLIGASLTRSIQRWDHHLQADILVAAMWFFEWCGDEILKRAAEPRSKIEYAITEQLERHAGDARLIGFCIRALESNALRTPAAAFLSAGKTSSFVEELINCSWLLADQELERKFRWVRDPVWFRTIPDHMQRASREQIAAMIRLIAASGLAVEKRVRFLVGCVKDRPSDQALLAVAQLIRINHESVQTALTNIVQSSTGLIRRICTLELRRRTSLRANHDVDEAPVLSPAEASPIHQKYSASTSSTIAPADASSRGNVESLEISASVQESLSSPNSLFRLRGLRALQHLKEIAKFAPVVEQLSTDADPIVRAAAVSLLGRFCTPLTRKLMISSLHDPEPRVTANAVEALEYRFLHRDESPQGMADTLSADEMISLLTPLLQSETSRVRANAIHAMLQVQSHEAGEALLAMLESDNRNHRLSALWVIEKLSLRSLVHRVILLAQNETDPRVRRRASVLASSLQRRQQSDSAPLETQPPNNVVPIT